MIQSPLNQYAPTYASGETKEIVKRFGLINKGGIIRLTIATQESSVLN